MGSPQTDPATAASASGGGGGVSLEASVRLAGIGVSVIDACPRELLYLTVGDIALEYLQEGQVWCGRKSRSSGVSCVVAHDEGGVGLGRAALGCG